MVDFSFEIKTLETAPIVGGTDEVGRGAFAGPVYSAVCIYHPQSYIYLLNNHPGVNDSKVLTQVKREAIYEWIIKNALSFGVGKSSVYEINKYGIVPATNRSFRRAIKKANSILKDKNLSINSLLVDAFFIPYVKGIPKKLQSPIIKGDSKSFSIASASIVAKVERDRYMTNLSQKPEYKFYLWNENKGYGTTKHRDAISKLGATKHHRKEYIRSLVSFRAL